MARSRKTRKIMTRGNRAYGLSYALSAIRANPFRAISLALTLSLGISLFASTMVWGDTGILVSIYDYLDDNAYQLQVTAEPLVPEALGQAETYLQQSPLVESTFRINSTVGLVNASSLPDSTMYDIEGALYSSGIKDCQVIFVDNEFLNRTASEFWYQGEFQLESGEVLVSSQFLYYVSIVFDVDLQVGDTIDFDLLTGEVLTQPAPIGTLGRVRMSSMTIAGVFDPKTTNSMIERALPSRPRANYIQSNLPYQVLGIRDSILMLEEDFAPNTLSPNGFFQPTTLVRLSAAGVTSQGPDHVASEIFDLIVGADAEYNITWSGADKVWEMQGAVNTYVSTLNLSTLALPVILLALFFSVFAADTFMAPRKLEIGIMRSKGASQSQVSSVFLWETAIIAVLSIVLGAILSALFAPLIASSIGFMVFDIETYLFYLSMTVITPSTMIRAVSLTVLPSMLFIIYQARKAAQTEIGLTLMEVTEEHMEQKESHAFTTVLSAMLLVLVLVMIYVMPNNPLLFLMELLMATAAWFFISYNGSRVSRVGLANVYKRMSFLLGQKNVISAGYLKMRKGRIIPLMVVLTLTISSTIAFAVQSESLRVDLNREVAYSIGSDLRIDCTARDFAFNDTLGTYDGIEEVVPVLPTWARIGSDTITIEGLYPDQYARIGHFDQSSFPDEEPADILSALTEVPNGIILSEFHAEFWNTTVGQTITLEMSGVGTTQFVDFVVVGIVHSAPGFGYAAVADIPYTPMGAGFGFQAPYGGFALANLDFIASTINEAQTTLFLADLSDDVNQTRLFDELIQLPGVYPTTPDHFDLKARSLMTALFLSTVQGLFSIGFAMSLILSVFALTISLSSVVRERRKEYAVMRAIGGSKKQVVSMVFTEFSGVVFAALALSIVLGIIFAVVMELLLNTMIPFSRILAATISFPMSFISIVVLIEIATMVIGAYLPAREAANTEPAVVLRNL
ncbi:MAG: ABC transporter permease [Candidatus Thorarchaeota archaeon]